MSKFECYSPCICVGFKDLLNCTKKINTIVFGTLYHEICYSNYSRQLKAIYIFVCIKQKKNIGLQEDYSYLSQFYISMVFVFIKNVNTLWNLYLNTLNDLLRIQY